MHISLFIGRVYSRPGTCPLFFKTSAILGTLCDLADGRRALLWRFPASRQSGEAAMTWEDLLAYCLAKPGAWQDEPWEGDVVVKVGGKIFAFFGSGDAPSVGLKCGASREAADEWLLRYPQDASVMAYIGRSGWNTLRIGGAIPDDELFEAIDASYEAVVSK